MDHPVHRLLTNHSPPPPPPPPPSTAVFANFPILAISLIGILATATFLLSYYVFVLKCCLNWQRGRSSSSPSLRHSSEPLVFYSAAAELHGLTPSSIRAIPVVRFSGSGAAHECAVCLNEFSEEEGLRLLPGCSHAFHVDCIDVWLQSNANCPICRCDVSSTPITFPILASRDDHNGSVVVSECVDARLQSVRRSFSMDVCLDRELDGGGGGDRRVRRGFFSFGHGRSSRSAVLPVQQVELS